MIVAKLTRLDAASARCLLTASVRMFGQTGDDENAEAEDGLEVAQPVGLLSRPKLTSATEAFVFELGEQLVVLHILDKSAPSQDVAEGETRLYGVNGDANADAVLRIMPDGTVRLAAHVDHNCALDVSGSGAVVVNSGNRGVARNGDPVAVAAAWSTWFTAVGAGSGAGPPPGSALGNVNDGSAVLLVPFP